MRRRLSPIPRRKSLSPQERTSLSPIHRVPGRRSPKHQRKSPKRQRRSPLRSPRDDLRTIEETSPVRRAPPRDKAVRTVESGKGSGSSQRRPVSERSPQRDFTDGNGFHNNAPALSPSPFKSPSYSETSPAARRGTVSDRRLSSPVSPAVRKRAASLVVGANPINMRIDKPIHDREHEKVHFAREEDKSKTSAKIKLHSAMSDEHANSVEKARYKKDPSPERLADRRSGEVRSRTDKAELKKKHQKPKSEIIAERVYPEYVGEELPLKYKTTLSNERRLSHQNDAKSHDRLGDLENVSKLSRKIDGNGRNGSVDSGSEESDDHRVEVKGKRKHKSSRKKDVTSDDNDSFDSHTEESKEAKRRRKEKKLKKEERRRQRAVAERMIGIQRSQRGSQRVILVHL